MNAADRPDGALPYRPAVPAPAAAAAPVPAVALRPPWDELEAAASPPKVLTLRVALRAVRRHWWQILLLWTAGSAALMALAYYKVKPSYESFALLKIEPTSRSLISAAYDPNTASGSYLDTQAQLIGSPEVLKLALQRKEVIRLPRIQQSLDPETELRKEVHINIRPKTSLIEVSMSSELPTEAATIVNAVIDAYNEATTNWVDVDTKREKERLQTLKKEIEQEVIDARSKLKELMAKLSSPPDIEKEKRSISPAGYHELEIQGEELALQRKDVERTKEYFEQLALKNGRVGPASEAELKKTVEQAFLVDPDAVRIAGEIKEAQLQLDRVKRLAPRRDWNYDPSARHLQRKLDDLSSEWDALWQKKEPVLRQRLASTGGESDPRSNIEHEIETAKMRIKGLEEHEKALRDRMKRLDVVSTRGPEGGIETQTMEFIKADLVRREVMLEQVDKAYFQLDYEARQKVRSTVIARPRPPNRPTTDNRVKLMAAAPVGMLMGLLGLFVLVEVRAGRVADPDDLPARLRLGVIGVVPPLPTLQAPRGLRGLRDERRRVEEFIQSLDQLRVTLCTSGLPGASPRRCVLITSATGGEGKTTLAAQLAGRCANAGLLTLLVDADLRRPSLGDLLEVPEGPGLAEVLSGEATAEEAMVTIGNAGGFHLLPAGSAGGDPSRLLQGETLGHLIARFRETFEVVIIDAPPVLAVPDALLLGRWADGAIVAVRHDTSRFPLVERANRRLTSIGIPVLGAVVNGVRPMEAAYGAYAYAYHDAAAAAAGDDTTSA